MQELENIEEQATIVVDDKEKEVLLPEGLTQEEVQHEVDDFLRAWKRAHTPYVAPKFAGRNELCPCGSNLKYKKCCLERDKATVAEIMKNR